MSDNKTRLLEETLKLFNMMGVVSGQGADGRLMSSIIAELEGTGPIPPRIEIPKGACPLCGARDMHSCDCDPMEQIAAASK